MSFDRRTLEKHSVNARETERSALKTRYPAILMIYDSLCFGRSVKTKSLEDEIVKESENSFILCFKSYTIAKQEI